MMSLVNFIIKMFETAPFWTIFMGAGLSGMIGGLGVYLIYKDKKNTSDNTPFFRVGVAGFFLFAISAFMIWSAFKDMAELP